MTCSLYSLIIYIHISHLTPIQKMTTNKKYLFILLLTISMMYQGACYLQSSCGGNPPGHQMHQHRVSGEPKSCCPEGSWPALQADYKVRGEIFDLGDTTVYHVGSSKKVLIMFSDIYGIYTGRHFSVADTYADLGFNVYVPQILTNPYDGQGSITDCIKSQDYNRMEKRFTDLLFYLNDKGFREFYSNGFCWGAYIGFKFASKFNGFKAFAGCHPSIRTSQYFNQTQQDLVQSIKCPAFFYPAGNDPDNLKQGGELVQILEKKFGAGNTGSISFPEEVHGWVIRGDITIPSVARDVKKAIELSTQYLMRF